MSVKDIARKTVDSLPEDADWDEVIERITLTSAISRGLAELDAGKGVPVQIVEEELKAGVRVPSASDAPRNRTPGSAWVLVGNGQYYQNAKNERFTS
jgi:predicted transcriptional regulator